MSGYSSLLHPDNRKELGSTGIFGQKDVPVSAGTFDKDSSALGGDLGAGFSKEEHNATWQDIFGAKKTMTMLPATILQERVVGGGEYDKLGGASGEQLIEKGKEQTTGGVSNTAFQKTLPGPPGSTVWKTSQIRHPMKQQQGGKSFADVVASGGNTYSVLSEDTTDTAGVKDWSANKLKGTDTVIDDTSSLTRENFNMKNKMGDTSAVASDTVPQASGWHQVGHGLVAEIPVGTGHKEKAVGGVGHVGSDLHSKDVQKLDVIKSHDQVTEHQKELKQELNKEVLDHGQDVIGHGGVGSSISGVVDKLSGSLSKSAVVNTISQKLADTGIKEKISGVGAQLSNQAAQLKSKAADVTQNIKQKKVKKQKQTGPSTMQNLQQKSSDIVHSAKQQVSGITDTASAKLSGLSDTASTKFSQLQDTASSKINVGTIKQSLNDNFQSGWQMFDRFRAKAMPAVQPVIGDIVPTVRSYSMQYYQSLQSFILELWQNPPYNKLLFNLIVFFNWICPLLFLHTKEAYSVLFGACISLLGQHLIQIRSGHDAFSPLNRLANGIWGPIMFFLWSTNDVGMLGMNVNHHGYLFHLWLRGLLMVNTCMCTIDVMEVSRYFDQDQSLGINGFQPFTKVNLTISPDSGNVLIVPHASEKLRKKIGKLTGKDFQLQSMDQSQQIGSSSLSGFGNLGSNVQAKQLEDSLQITMKIPASAISAAAQQQGISGGQQQLSGSFEQTKFGGDIGGVKDAWDDDLGDISKTDDTLGGKDEFGSKFNNDQYAFLPHKKSQKFESSSHLKKRQFV